MEVLFKDQQFFSTNQKCFISWIWYTRFIIDTHFRNAFVLFLKIVVWNKRWFYLFEQAKGMIEEVEATGGAQRPDDKMKDTSTSKKGGASQGAKKKKK